jgi:hypothetical protein
MRQFTSRSWNWIASQLNPRANKSGRRIRRRQLPQTSAVPADVERLESRALLSVTYHGGALLPAVEAQAVYLGSDWSGASLSPQTSTIDTFVSTIVNSPYMDMLTNAGYKVGRGTASAGAIDSVTLSKVASVGVTDTQIQQDLQAMITAGHVQAPDANRLYIVYVEPGVVVHMGSDASNSTFLGYHGAFGGTAGGKSVDIHYVVIPYPGSPNFSPQSQGFANAFDEQTAVTSHELAESVTDPNVNYKTLGWYDDRLNGEIGDLTSKTTRMGVYLVQDVVNQQDQVISPTTTTTTNVGTPNLTATATNSTTASLSWNAVSGSPTGYRIFETIGSKTTTITVGSSTTSYQVTGMTSGSTVTFQVEAYNATSKADSQSVTLTMPSTTTTLAAPTVKVVVTSPYTATLSWGAVAGAQGYVIYYVTGGHWYILGTVRASTTSVQIVGMSPKSTYQFVVGAFNATTEADSAVVSVTTPAATRRHH